MVREALSDAYCRQPDANGVYYNAAERTRVLNELCFEKLYEHLSFVKAECEQTAAAQLLKEKED